MSFEMAHRQAGAVERRPSEQLEVMGNGKAVSISVDILSGRTPSSAGMSDLFDAYKLADYLIDEPARLKTDSDDPPMFISQSEGRDIRSLQPSTR